MEKHSANLGEGAVKAADLLLNCIHRITSSQAYREVEEAIAKFVVASGSSLRLVELETFREVLSKVLKLGGAHLTPSRKKLSSTLLEWCYNDVKNQILGRLQAEKASGFTFVTDGWKTFINYVVKAGGSSFFWSIATMYRPVSPPWMALKVAMQ